MKATNIYYAVCGVRKLCRFVLFGLIVTALGVTSQAAVFSWSGGGVDGNWSDSANWGFVGTPGNGDTVIFSASQPHLLNTNDISSNLTLNQIRFVGAGGGYQIYGNGFTITNGIIATNTAGANAISFTNLITIANNDLSVIVGNAVSLTITAGLTGPFGLVKNGGGTLVLAGPISDTYTGTTLINQGVVQTEKASSPPATAIPGNVIVGDGTDSATLQNIYSLETSTSANVTINSNGVWNMNSAFDNMGVNLTLNGNAVLENGTLQLSPSPTITANPGGAENCLISGSINVNSGVCTLVGNEGSGGGFLDIAANVGGSATINKTGNGYLSLDGANTFTGQMNVQSGILGAYNPLALGSTNAGTTVNNTASLWVYFSVTNEPLTIASTGTGLVCPGGTVNWVATNINLAAQTTIESDGSFNLQCLISGVGGFTKTGLGTLTLSGNGENTYFGATAVNAGVLQLNQTGGHAIGGSSSITIGDGIGGANADVIRYINAWGNEILAGIPIFINDSGLMDLNGFSDDVGPITMDGGNITTGSGQLELLDSPISTLSSANGNSTISGNLLLESGGSDVFAISNTLTVSASISDISSSETLIKSGPGYLLLTGSNSYNGLTVDQQGWLWAENNFALGTTISGTVVSNGATLVVPSGFGITNESLALNGPGEPGWAALDCENGGIGTWSGPVTLNATSTFGAYAGGTLNVLGTISGPGGVDEVASGGTVGLGGSAANTYGGLTSVDFGILLLEKPYSVLAVPGNVNVNANGTLRLGGYDQIAHTANVNVVSGGLFDFGVYYAVFDTLTGSGSVTFGTEGYLEIGENNGTSTFNGLMSGTGFVGGYTVGKFGTGTFTMNANNTYQNGSDVFGGTLIVNGTQPQSPVRTMESGTTLGGSGQLGDIPAEGTIAPGIAGAPAIFTGSNVAFSASGNFTVRLNGPNPGTGYDQLVILGTNALGNATLTVLPSFSQPVSIGQQFTIINNQGAGAILGTFNGLADNSIFGAGSYYFRINYAGGSGNDVVLTLLGVPDKTVTLTSVAKGWYSSSGGNNPGSANYFAGENNLNTDTNIYRDWFVFDAPISPNAIINAELIINGYTISSPQGEETYLVRGVSTPIATLEAGGPNLTNIYMDLGSNAVYGVRDAFTNESDQFLIIPLNVKFFNDIAAVAGGQIALGGSIVTLDPTNTHNEFLFGFSGYSANDVQLRLTYGTSTTLSATDSGWYDDTGFHGAANRNYLAGLIGATYYRDFFVYNLPIISGPLVNAQLLVNCYSNISPSGLNTYQLHDVSNPIVTLTNSASGATGTYADLGSGSLYGGRDIYVSESYLPAAIPLNTAFVSAVDAQSGGQIALGGMVDSPTNGSVFGFSLGNPTDAQLWLGFLSAPAATPVFVDSSNLGNNLVQFTLSGTSGTSNEIQGSFDFQNWDYMGDLEMTNTTSVFSYTNNAPFPYRFFRAKLMP